MRRFALLIATFGYAGLIPFAPGTVGSLVGLVLYAAVIRTGGRPIPELLTIVLLFAAGAWAGTIAEQHFGSIDPGPVIIDEVVGMLITLFLVPVNVRGASVGFVVFRLFDIVKPFPASRFERLPGGWGVMADDAMAAVYGNLTMRVLWWLVPSWIV